MDLLKPETEKCVLCGAEISFQNHMPVSERDTFIPGCGQLCPLCYARLNYKIDMMELSCLDALPEAKKEDDL